MKEKKIPLRTCIACGSVKPKRELVRVVRSAEGKIFVDLSSKANGRGAYVCPDEKCASLAMKKERLSRALKASLSEEELEKLRKEFLKELDRQSEGI